MNRLSIPLGTQSSVKRRGAVARIDQYLSGSLYRPKTTCRVAHDGQHIFLRFDVRDRYVICRRRRLHGPVWTDSCVEFFVRPKKSKGYFNFELNCAGQMLVFYIENWRRRADKKLVKFTPITRQEASTIAIATNLKAPIVPEITKPTTWWLEATIPIALMEKYVGRIGKLSGQTWRANFQKCASACSHPHWATWNPIGPIKNFHQPDKFGELRFE